MSDNNEQPVKPFDCPTSAAINRVISHKAHNLIASQSAGHGKPAGQDLKFEIRDTLARHFKPNAGARPGRVVWNHGLSCALADACAVVFIQEDFCDDLLSPTLAESIAFVDKKRELRPNGTVLRDYQWTIEHPVHPWDAFGLFNQSNVRFTIAGTLQALCIDWILLHEIGHVVLGHHKWRNGGDSSAFIMEASSQAASDTLKHPTVMHIAELEADWFATTTVLESLFSQRTVLQRMLELQGVSNQSSNELLNRLARLVPSLLPAILAAFQGGAHTQAGPNHPSPAARHYWISYWLQRRVDAGDLFPLNAADTSKNGYLYQAWKAIYVAAGRQLSWNDAALKAELEALELIGAEVIQKHGGVDTRLTQHRDMFAD